MPNDSCLEVCSGYQADDSHWKSKTGCPQVATNKKFPGNELLRRYDMYPKLKGRESQEVKSMVEDNPPTGPPHGPILYPQEGACGSRLNKKTNASGVACPGPTHKQKLIKETIRNLRFRWQQTGSTARPATPRKSQRENQVRRSP